MERFAHLVEKIYNKTKEGISLENLYCDIQSLQQEMQLALANDIAKGSNKVNVTLPSCYTPKKQEEVFSANFLKSEIEEKTSEIQPTIDDELPKTAPVISLVDESDDEDETPDYYINTSFKTIDDSLVQTSAAQGSKTNEHATLLVEAPVKDLKSAISLNEKFIFINELFRGEETVYERSIATIQNFDSYTDADLWIKRELITKQGWQNNDENVEYFIELVKRRFAS